MIVIVVYVVGGTVLRRRESHHAQRNEPLDGVLGPRPAPRLLQGRDAAIAAQALYAFARARVDLRLSELHAALDRHEGDPTNWARFEVLDRVEGALGELVEEVEKL